MSTHRVDPWKYETNVNILGLCSRCSGLGVWITPRGIVSECPKLQLNLNFHPSLTLAAEAILRAGRRLADRGVNANPLEFAVACDLARATTETPSDRDLLLLKHFSWASTNRLRKFQAIIEILRRNWLLPIGSRKEQPSGHWIITDSDDFESWITRAKKSPLSSLTTIHAVARANFPVFADELQLELNLTSGDGFDGLNAAGFSGPQRPAVPGE